MGESNMLFFNHDPLRDPIWQFIGVIISAVLSVSALILPYLLPGGKDKKENLSKAYWALIHHDNSLGCIGSLGLSVFLIVAWYLLYHLLLRMFFLDRSLDQNTLLVTTIVIIFSITIFFTIFKHNQLLLLLVF